MLLCVFFYDEAFHVESYLAPCSHVKSRVLSVLVSIVITTLGEERVGFYASRAFVCLSDIRYFFSSSWFRGSAADCHCGTP